MTIAGLTIFLLKACLFYVLLWYLVRKLMSIETPPVPKRLMQLRKGFEKGTPHRRYWSALRAEPMFDEHYRKVPGRMSCTVLPYKCNEEDVWQLRVGFKTTAAEKPSKYISIPVYKDGKIYDV